MRGIIIDKDGTLFNYAYVWGPVVAKAIREGFYELGLRDRKLDSTAIRFEELFGVDEFGNNHKDGILFRPDLALFTISKMVLASLMAGLNPFKVKNKVFSKLNGISSMISEEIQRKEFPGIREIFELLKRNDYVIGIVTNDTVDTTKMFLDYIGIREYVDFIRGKDNLKKKKPSAEAFNQFLKEFNLSATDVAVIGDTKEDMQFALNGKAGYRIAVLTGSGDEKLLNRMADKVYPTILDIKSDPVLFEKRP